MILTALFISQHFDSSFYDKVKNKPSLHLPLNHPTLNHRPPGQSCDDTNTSVLLLLDYWINFLVESKNPQWVDLLFKISMGRYRKSLCPEELILYFCHGIKFFIVVDLKEDNFRLKMIQKVFLQL